jgi:hypothetical protein
MTRAFVKNIAAAGAAAGLVAATAGSAFPASKPKATPAPAKPKATPTLSQSRVVKPVVFRNQSVTLAQGLTPRAALTLATKFVKYRVTTPRYVPSGFSLVAVTVYPFVPDNSPLSDTQTFYKAHARVVTDFEVDHKFGSPYVYYSPTAPTTAKVGSYTATVVEEKGVNLGKHTKVDLLYVYWYNKTARVATEVTADVQSSGLSRSIVLKIAGSIS